MVHALPDDGNRYELIGGDLFVTPAPTNRHQRASLQLALILSHFAATNELELLDAPCAVRLADGGEVQPDLLVFPRKRGADLADMADIADLVLAIEILSPGTQRTDRHAKRRLYQNSGVDEYWMVDLSSRSIERWRPNDLQPEVLSTDLRWEPLPGRVLTVDLQAYFRIALE